MSKAKKERSTQRDGELTGMPRWWVALQIIRRDWVSLIFAGFLAGAVMAGLTLLPLVPGIGGAVPFLQTVFQANASLIVDRSASQITATSSEEQEQQVQGMADVSIPTIQSLLAQPLVANHVSRIIGGDKAPAGSADAALYDEILGLLPPDDLALLRDKKKIKGLQDALPEDLLEMVEAEPRIDKKLPYDVIYSPLVTVQAKASEADLARLLANLWVATFEVFYDQSIARKQLKATKDVLTEEYKGALSQWQSAQEELNKILAGNDGVNGLQDQALPALKRQLDRQENSLELVTEDFLKVERELQLAKLQYDQVALQIKVLTDETGDWIGRVELESAEQAAIRNDTQTTQKLLQQIKQREKEALRILSEDSVSSSTRNQYLQMLRQTLIDKNYYERATRRLREFEQESPLEELELRKVDAVARLNEYLRELGRKEIDQLVAEKALEKLDIQRKEIPVALKLKQAVPAEYLFLSRAQNGEMNKDKDGDTELYEFTTEVVNPAYEKVELDYHGLRTAKQKYDQEVIEYRLALEEAEKEIREQQVLLSALRLEKTLLEKEQEAAAKLHSTMQERYNDLRLNVFELSGTVTALEIEAEQLKNRQTELRRSISENYRSILEKEDAEERFTSQITVQQTRVQLLQERLLTLEAQLSENSKLVRVATYAIAPARRIWPRRSLLAIGAAFFGVLIGFAFRFTQVELAALEQREKANTAAS